MARALDGSTQQFTIAQPYLSGADGPWTVACWFRNRAVDGTEQVALLASLNAGETAGWALQYGADGGTATVILVTGGATPADVALTATLPATQAARGVFVAVRKAAAGSAAVDCFVDGVKSVMSAGTAFTIPATTQAGIGGWPGGSLRANADIAEVAIWPSVALADDQLAELGAGVAADQVAPAGLAAYWPLRGHSTPELNYAVRADVLTHVGAPPGAAHPEIVPPWRADVVEPAWIVDLDHPTLGAVRIASRAVTQEFDWDVLGAAYPERLAADIRLIDQLPDVGLSVMSPATTVIQIRNVRGTFDPADDWTGATVRVRYYDRISHALTDEFSGVIDDQNIANQVAAFTCVNQDAAELDQMVPRVVIEPADGLTGVVDNETGLTVRRDLGAPVPVVCGEGGFVSPPYIGFGGGTVAVNGHDMLLGWGGDIVVRKVLFDIDRDSPGLEPGTQWNAPRGTVAHVSGSVFTVAGTGLDLWYEPGRPMRSSNNGGTTWHYAHVASVALNDETGGTVTLSASILGASLGTVQVADDYAVLTNNFQYVGTGGTTALTSLRFYGDSDSAILAQVGETSRGNPAEAIRFILSDPDEGLGLTVDADSFDTAAADFSAAGLGTVVRDVLGCDKQQRRGIDVVNELASLRRARLWKDAATAAWKMQVDTHPGTPVATFEYGEGTRGNVAEVLDIRPPTRSNSVGTLKLRYDRLGRDRGAKSMELTDYQSHCLATVGVGARALVLTNPWLRSTVTHLEPARVAYHIAKTLEREHRKPRFRVRHQGRRVRLGDLVTLNLKTSPTKAVTGDFRVLSRERTLTEFLFTVGGPWDEDVFETDAGVIQAAVAQPSGDTNPDERERKDSDANLILNADFSAGLRAVAWDDTLDKVILPGWRVQAGRGLDTIRVVRDFRAKGGAYLELGVKSGNSPSGSPVLGVWQPDTDTDVGVIPVNNARNYLFSLYTETPTRIRLRFLFFDANGDFIDSPLAAPPLRAMPGDLNGLGWPRIYVAVTVPDDAATVTPEITIRRSSVLGAITHRFDAVQLEEVTRSSVRPTPWKRHPQYGIHVTSLLAGDLTVRAPGRIENGTMLLTDPSGGTVTLSGGGTVTLGTVQPGLMTGVSGRVVAGITGATAWVVALNYGGGTVRAITSHIGTATTAFADEKNAFDAISLRTATPLVAIAVGGTAFTGGTVAVTPHLLQHVAPDA